MPTSFAGRDCVDPALLRRECDERDPPIPTDRWWGRANVWLDHLHRAPSRGSVLLRRQDLDAIPLTTSHDLLFSGVGFGTPARNSATATRKKVTLLRAECVTPGAAGDPLATYLCDLVDRRHHLAKIPLDAAYNVRDPAGSYLTGTLNTGVAYTWQQVVDALVTALGLPAMVLPFTPDGTPENLIFWGGFAWAALCDVLDRLACAVDYDGAADAFALVRRGVADAAAAAVMTDLDANARRLWDGYFVDPVRAWRPEAVKVLFRRRPDPTDGSSVYYAVTSTLPAAAGVEPGTVVTVRDDLAALGATGSPSNAAACATRAAERAADWLRERESFGRPLQIAYADVVPTLGTTVLGKTVSAASLEDRGGHQDPRKSAILARPDDDLERFRPWEPPFDPGCCGWGADDYTLVWLGLQTDPDAPSLPFSDISVVDNGPVQDNVLMTIPAGQGRVKITAGLALEWGFTGGDAGQPDGSGGRQSFLANLYVVQLGPSVVEWVGYRQKVLAAQWFTWPTNSLPILCFGDVRVNTGNLWGGSVFDEIVVDSDDYPLLVVWETWGVLAGSSLGGTVTSVIPGVSLGRPGGTYGYWEKVCCPATVPAVPATPPDAPAVRFRAFVGATDDSGTTVGIPRVYVSGGTSPYTYDVDWGDGSPHGTTAGPLTHVYTTPGTYTITVTVTDALSVVLTPVTRTVTVP